MSYKILSLLILTATLSGCAKTNYNSKEFKIVLPEMPVAGEKVAAELAANCNNTKCPNLNLWLNDLYVFKQQYNVYQTELLK